MFDKLAEELKNARIKNNFSLKQLSARTRIDIKFLEAIEEGNFAFLPELYVKAFIKEYANVVGLNVELILKNYEAAKEGLPFDEIDSNEPEPENKEPEKPLASDKVEEEKETISEKKEVKPKVKLPDQNRQVYSPQPPVFDSTSQMGSNTGSGNKNVYFIGAVIGGIVIVFGLIYLIFFRSSGETIISEKPYDEVVSESRQRYEEKQEPATDSSHNITAASDSLNLLIQTADTSWVKIIIDNSREEEFIMFPNSQKSLAAVNNFKITFGRSAAIKLKLNNKPLEFSPKTKFVSYVMISSKGLEFLSQPPVKGNN